MIHACVSPFVQHLGLKSLRVCLFDVTVGGPLSSNQVVSLSISDLEEASSPSKASIQLVSYDKPPSRNYADQLETWPRGPPISSMQVLSMGAGLIEGLFHSSHTFCSCCTVAPGFPTALLNPA